MKKILLTLLVLGVAAGAYAQTTFGARVGPDFSSWTSKSSGEKTTSQMLVGVEGGVYANVPVAPEFYVQPPLMYEGKGDKNTGTDNVRVTTRLHYLVLPVDLVFKPEMPNGSGSWIVGVGPYLGYGISGKTLLDADSIKYSYNPFSGNAFSSSGDAMKRKNAGEAPRHLVSRQFGSRQAEPIAVIV